VPEPGQSPACHDVPPDLHLRLIPGLGRASGDDGHAIMLREGGVGAIALGFIAVGTGHSRLEVIGDDPLGHPAEGRTGPSMRADPVGQTLGLRGLGVRVVRCPQDGDEHRPLRHLPAAWVDDGEPLAGIINKELLPSAVALPQNQVERARPGAIALTASAVLKALGCGALVLLPPQAHDAPLAFQRVVPCGPVRRWPRREGSDRVGGNYQPLQGGLIKSGGPGPRQACGLCPSHVLGNGRSTDAKALGHVAIAQPLSPLQTQDFRDMTPGSPLGRPLLLPPGVRKVQGTEGEPGVALDGLPRAVLAGVRWHQWQRSPGMAGRFAVEYAPSGVIPL
jgi:hypothetical protein